MPSVYFAQGAFDPELTPVLTAAFDEAWETMRRTGDALAADSRAETTRELLAHRLISAMRAGESDSGRLVADAIDHVARCSQRARPSNDNGSAA